MAVTHFIIFSILFVAAFAKLQNFHACEKVSPDYCTVSNINVDPCGKTICKFKTGKNASLAFDFTPNFETPKLKTSVYWVNGDSEVEFAGMSSNDGCEFTTCPTVSGTLQSFSYNLYIGKKLPPGKYPLRWKVWNEENKEQMCCFELSIQIKRGH